MDRQVMVVSETNFNSREQAAIAAEAAVALQALALGDATGSAVVARRVVKGPFEGAGKRLVILEAHGEGDVEDTFASDRQLVGSAFKAQAIDVLLRCLAD